MPQDHQRTNDLPAHPTDRRRYAALRTEDGSLVIYDDGDHRAWLESSAFVSLPAMA